MQEIWKDVPEYEGIYQVSNLGNVRSLNYNNNKKTKEICKKKHKTGYLNVVLCKNSKKKKKVFTGLWLWRSYRIQTIIRA